MNVGLFGGSFNPPHVCHSLVTIWALQTRRLDEVWWIPTFQHAFDKRLVGYDHRRRMCELVTADFRGVRVSNIESELGGESRTIETVRALEEKSPEVDFSLIVGADILEEADEWKAWDELMERVELVVVGRAGYDEAPGEDPSTFVLPDVSSTKVRRALHQRDHSWLDDWIPAEVLDYVDQHDLYRGDD